MACKFDFCPILNIVSNADENEKKPDARLIQKRPAESRKAGEDDENMKQKASGILEFQFMDLVELQNKVTDKVT